MARVAKSLVGAATKHTTIDATHHTNDASHHTTIEPTNLVLCCQCYELWSSASS